MNGRRERLTAIIERMILRPRTEARNARLVRLQNARFNCALADIGLSVASPVVSRHGR